ncbi:MAG: transglycosylase domain-containing protein [Chitinophagales bacterium]
MIFLLAFISFIGLIAALIKLLPDLSQFVWSKTKKISFPKEFVDFGAIVVILFFISIIAVTGFVFYKFSIALVAYILSDDLVSFFILLRGVFSFSNESQNPFAFNHLISGLILTPAIQFLAVHLIYRGVRKFLNEINQKYNNPASYSESDVFYFGFIAVIIFILLDLVLYSQSIPMISQVAHLTFLGLSKIALGIFYLSLAHINLLKVDKYRNSILNYVEMKQYVQKIVFSPWRIVLTVYIIALILHLPFFTGIQFHENNWLIGFIGIIACIVSYLLLRLHLAKGFNYLGVIMLVEGPSELGPNMNIVKPEKEKKFYYVVGLVSLLFFVFKMKLFFFFVTLMLMALLFLITLLVSTYFFFLFISLIRAKVKNFSAPEVTYQPIIIYLLHSSKSLLKSVGIMISAIFLICSLLTYFPIPLNLTDNNEVNAVFDKDDNLLFSDNSKEYPSIAVEYSKIPPFLLKCLIINEDRGFLSQNDFLPNRSNWHGFSFTVLYRYFLDKGGGSNLNQQFIKNKGFFGFGKFPQDIQKKFAEILTSYQLSNQYSPEEIITFYLNVASFHGKGHCGIINGAYYAFGKPLKELNQLEMMYLITTLKSGSLYKTTKGYIKYSEVAYYPEEIKKTLLIKAESWNNQGFLSKQDIALLKSQNLRFANKQYNSYCHTTTNEFLRKEINYFNNPAGNYISSLSLKNQKQIAGAVSNFEFLFENKIVNKEHNLYSAVLVVDIKTGNIIGHYGGRGETDLTSFGTGYNIASLIKPFLLIQLLEEGWNFDEIRLYDGDMKGKLTPKNFRGVYSNYYVGIPQILRQSLNAPMVNIRELINPIYLFERVENKFYEMNISKDPYLDFKNKSKHGEYEVNYPLGSRNMTLYDIAQMYQVLLNGGMYRQLTVFSSYFNSSGQNLIFTPKHRQIYNRTNADNIKLALSHAMEPEGTGIHIKDLLPTDKTYYFKTGTSDEAKHGYTVLSDGKTLIVSWVSYCKNENEQLKCNGTPEIPFGSGAKTAGALAALIYNKLQD